MTTRRTGSFPSPGGGPAETNYYSSLDNMETREPQTVSLACPSCGEICAVDTSVFPVGRTGAVCSACEEQMVLTKGADGSISVRRVGFDGPPPDPDGQPDGDGFGPLDYDSLPQNAFTDTSSPVDDTRSQTDLPAHFPGMAPPAPPAWGPGSYLASGGNGSGPVAPGGPDDGFFSRVPGAAPGPVGGNRGVPGAVPDAAKPKAPGSSRAVVCPKCLGRYRIPVAKIPKQGGWATCPSCGERFIVKLDELSFNDAPPARPAQAGQAPGPAKPRGGAYMYRLGQSEQLAELEVSVLDPMSPAVKRYWLAGLVAAVLLMFGVEAYILHSSWRSATDLAAAGQSATPAPPQVYGLPEFTTDLKNLQRRSVSAKYLDRSVNYSGYESRVYKYAVAQLDPGACTAITRLAISSRSPSQGLLINATCFDEAGRPLPLRVDWNGRYADLYVDGQERMSRLNVLMYKPAPDEAAAAEAASETGTAGETEPASEDGTGGAAEPAA
ncbi:MAG: zinc-ribbon domain-containing protein [Deltaproteobacteria bacterium]|nr:zinc-ribbon domain-containing protein [Deltaproteobacteria bacterium]